MAENVRNSDESTKFECYLAEEKDRELVFSLLRKYQINLKRNEIDFENSLYLIDYENLRIAHLGKIGHKHYMLYSVSKAKEARGRKNIEFLRGIVAYMFLKTDALVIDTKVDRRHIQARIAHAANPHGEIIWENENEIYKRWKIGDCYQYATSEEKLILIEKMQACLKK